MAGSTAPLSSILLKTKNLPLRQSGDLPGRGGGIRLAELLLSTESCIVILCRIARRSRFGPFSVPSRLVNEVRHPGYSDADVAATGRPGLRGRRDRGRCGLHHRGRPAPASRTPVAVCRAAGACRRHLHGQDRAAAGAQPVEPVAVPCGELLGHVCPGPRSDRLHRGGECVGAVHLAPGRAQSAPPRRLQHRLFDDDGVGRRLAAGAGDGAISGEHGRRSFAPPPSSARSTSSSTRRWWPARSRSRPASRHRRVWHRNFLWSAPSYLAGAALAAIATAASARGWFGWLVLLAVPLYLVFRSYHTVVARLREEQDQTHRAMEVQLATIEALALAIEAKAGWTPEHIRSIQQYAAMLADAAGLSDAEVQAVRTAALLHDIGNMAVPEHILAKPVPLTPEEFERVKNHPRVGADILRNVPFGAPVADLVLCHHERWDGLGYPAGMRGDEIPVGARILAIADCYSTLQSSRPYRPARGEAAAVAELRAQAGTAFDPALVDLLIRQLNLSAAPSAGEEDVWAQGESRSRCRTSPDPPRGADAVRNRAGARLQPRRRRRDGARRRQGRPAGAVRHVRALPGQRYRRLRVPLCPRARNRGAPQVGAAILERDRAEAAVVRRRPRRQRRRARRAAAVPADLRRCTDWRHRDLPHRAGILHRRASPRARTRQRAGRGGHLQFDAIRADRARVAHRRTHRARQPPVARSTVRERARTGLAQPGGRSAWSCSTSTA